MALTWFETNYMKLNCDKCHLLVSGHHYEEMFVKIGNDIIWESKSVMYVLRQIENLVFSLGCEISCLQEREELYLSPLSNHNLNTVL